MKKALLFALALIAVGCGPEGPPSDGPYEIYHENGQLMMKGTFKDGELDGPYEFYYENGQLEARGTLNMREECGEWLEDGETVTYPPCPPDLEDGN